MSSATAFTSESLWLRSKPWDLTWISGSALLMMIPYASYYGGQALGFNADDARNAVNVLVAFLIGGPHMYATHTRTTLDPTFHRSHPSIIPAAFIIPAVVIYLGLYHFVFLLTFFFMWASVHVLHQIIYLVNCYTEKDPRPTKMASRVADYAVVLLALYPVAMYRFVHGTFHIGEVYLYFPEALKHDAVWVFTSFLFAAAVTFYLYRARQDFKAGRGNWPKTILIGVTVLVSFVTPMFHELDVAFQGMNTWHSFQYLGLTWYINRLRYERGELARPIMQRISSPGTWWKYYGFNILMNCSTLIVWGLLLLTRAQTGLTFDQSYYIVILCFLLTHYYHDHILFQSPHEIRQPVVQSA